MFDIKIPALRSTSTHSSIPQLPSYNFYIISPLNLPLLPVINGVINQQHKISINLKEKVENISFSIKENELFSLSLFDVLAIQLFNTFVVLNKKR